MVGRAQQLLKGGESPSRAVQEAPTTSDLALARRLAGGCESVLLPIAYLCAATRMGHLCVKSSADALSPSPEALGWSASRPNWQGMEEMKSDLIVHEEGRWYLRRYWEAEERVVERVGVLLRSPPGLSFALGKVDRWLAEQSSALSEEQARAIAMALTQPLTLLCGGPGTGKSYTVRFLLRLMRELSGPELRMAVVAPTGKAVGNLRAALREESSTGLVLSTLHSLLKIYRSAWEFEKPPVELPYDLIVVDEASMIDVALLAQLLRSVRAGTRLVLMGDPDQLPPVEAGGLFGDLVATLEERCVVRLTHCRRAELEGIVALANAVRSGELREVERVLDRSEEVGCRPLSDVGGMVSRDVEGWRLLAATRRGGMGVDSINRLLLDQACSSRVRPLPVPIMISRNSHRLQLYNGETGTLMCHDPQRGGVGYRVDPRDYATFPDVDGEVRTFSAALLPPFEFAYCLSIHKSQGSEFDRVGIVLPDSGETLCRELLYTAVTRAKREVLLLGNREGMAAALGRHMVRFSGVRDKLRSLDR